MANLHLITVSVVNSTTLTATFTENLNEDIGTSNVIIQSQLDGINDAAVLKIDVQQATLTITCQPLVPLVSYYVIFQSTAETPFNSLNGDATLYQAGMTNQFLILGPIEQENPIQNFLINYLRNQIYDQISDPTSVSGSFIQTLSYVLSRALYDIRQVKNENYLDFTVNDELKIRGFGPYDRLNEESAFEILRVGRTPSGTTGSMSIDYPIFPANPVSLLAISISSEILKPVSSNDTPKTFDINSFILTVANINVSILTTVVFNYSDGRDSYIYSIDGYGYQILNGEYDQANAYSFATLANNQFKLSASILADSTFSIENISQVLVSYQYRDLGRIISANSVIVNTVLSSNRETLPPLETIFNLANAPIVDSNGNPGTIGDVVFSDPNAYPAGAAHPAFVNELVFNLAALPSTVGDYSIDYISGTVYVFGQDLTNSGTGASPPVASYSYLHTYVSEIDYVYDETDNNLVALPFGSLLLNDGSISFDYEQVFIPGIDYIGEVHIEELAESLQNRLLSSNILRTEHSPITNIFRIFNQSTGEVYTADRWLNDKIYFSYDTPPRVVALTHERASFATAFNTILFVNNTLQNGNGLSVYQCFLPNNQLIAATEDGIASSIDTPISFSETSLFQREVWFDINEVLVNNLNRLTAGLYTIDYANGIVYLGIAPGQGIDLGNVSYKTNSIIPSNPHLLSVENIYYQINTNSPKNKQFDYQSFGEGFIVPASFDPSDEAYLNNNFTAPYILLNNQIGAFVDTIFYPMVSNNIKFIRGLFEFDDLKFNPSPLNFASAATFTNRTITVQPLAGLQYGTVQYNLTDGYYAILNQNVSYQSANITFNFSVIRNSDRAAFSISSIVLGETVKLLLSNTNSPHLNDAISIRYSFIINNISRTIANYNKGEYYIDYTYVADEIIISYEYGDNYLDFSQSMALSPNDQYFVSYNVGALRDALQKNFGALINIPELDQFEVNFPRENYRDALTAALTSFLQGPSLSAIKNIGKTISHIEPIITESAFTNWSLGSSLLQPAPIKTTGAFNLLPAKYGSGPLINTIGQTISMPMVSNLRIAEGTFETWILPSWDGIDNNAELQIKITKDGYAFNSNLVFVGGAEYHPESINGIITLSKNGNVNGIPQKNKDGVYLYYAPDTSGQFDRWFFEVIDGYSNLSNIGISTTYAIQISSSGLFYDVKSINNPKPNNLRITSGTNTVSFTLTFTATTDQGITFVSDQDCYIMDAGGPGNTNRLSLYKDPSGYLNFRVFDSNGNTYVVSGNISSWQAGELHQVSAAWTLNSLNKRDEIHLFIDGFEVPNIIRYGSPVAPYLHENFRTINPEEIAGKVSQNIIGSIDLVATAGSTFVSSSLSFNAYGIVPGATLYIEEAGFSLAGYTITNVNGNTLTLSVPMPLSLANGIFSINRQSFELETPIDIYPNITVSTISSLLDGTDGYVAAGSSTLSSALLNFEIKDILPGYLLRIDNDDFAQNYVILSVASHSLTFNGIAPETVSGASFHLYTGETIELPGVRALRPDYSISESTDGYFTPQLTITNGVLANDLILIETLGLNNRLIDRTIYQWSNSSNIIQTMLPAPVSINQMNIDHILLAPFLISQKNSSITGSSFTFTTNTSDGYFDQPQFNTLSSAGTNANLTSSAGSVLLTNGNDFFPDIVGEQITISNAVHLANNGEFTVQAYHSENSISYTNVSSPDGYDTVDWLWTSDFLDRGRSLAITISSDHNLDFTLSPLTVLIDGYTYNNILTSETLSFTKNETLETSSKFTSISSIRVNGDFNNQNRAYLTLAIAEALSVIEPENGATTYPLIRYSYQTNAGNTLSGSGNTVSDGYNFFSVQNIGSYLIINSPGSVAGTYQISAVSADHLSLTISPTLPTSFSNGAYQILNASTYRSGFQNGFLTFEQATLPGEPYSLAKGQYKIEYNSYLSIPIAPSNRQLFLGTDINGANLLNGIIDETKISSTMLTDIRIGEIASAKQESITKDFNSLKQLVPTSNTIFLCHYNTLPFTNSASFYGSTQQQNDFIQSSLAPNDNFAGSAALYTNPIVIDNTGILSGETGGTIEFWISPKFDTYNDPNYRYYFDATSVITEEAISSDPLSINATFGAIGQVLSIKVKDGNSQVDYFAGGRVEISNNNAIIEDTISLSSSSVRVSKPILQVITVKIANDPVQTDYFANGNIGTDGETIYLGKQLPQNNLSLVVSYKPLVGNNQVLNSQVIRLKTPLPQATTKVIITYIPAGTQGDRISIFKDPSGFLNFNVRASNIEYLVRAPILWSQGSWHRVKASYQFNGGLNNDSLHLLVDGYEHGNILFGNGLVFGQSPYVFGSTFTGGSRISANIIFKDTLNQLFLGSDYRENNTAYVLMSNCRLSDIMRPIFAPYSESIDVNWNNNLSAAFPVISDLYTTLLLDFGNLTSLITDFATLIDETGNDFRINIQDEFGIVASSPIIYQTLTAILNSLKPASSRMLIELTE